MEATLETLTPQPTKGLLEAMALAMAEIGMAHKSATNAYDRYQYATLEDYLKAIREPCQRHGLIVCSDTVGPPEFGTRKTKSGNEETVCRVRVETRVMHAASEGFLCVTAYGEGQDRGDKSIYKAITGGRKYSLAMLFGIYTTDDPEVDSHDERDPGPAPPPNPSARPTQTPERGEPSAEPQEHPKLAWWRGAIQGKADMSELMGALDKTANHQPLIDDPALNRAVLEAFADEFNIRQKDGRLSDNDHDLLRQRLVAIAKGYDARTKAANQ